MTADGALDDLKALGQQRGVALVKLDVVARGRAHFQTHGLTHDEGHGFGFGFAHGGGGEWCGARLDAEARAPSRGPAW